MYKKFKINRRKIKGGCQSGRKVVTHNSKSDLFLTDLITRWCCLHTYVSTYLAICQIAKDWENWIGHFTCLSKRKKYFIPFTIVYFYIFISSNKTKNTNGNGKIPNFLKSIRYLTMICNTE